MEKGIALLSGGMDSATMLAVALSECDAVYPLLFDYHQRHTRELDWALKQVDHWKEQGKSISPAKNLEIDMQQIGGSALTSPDIDVPRGDEKFYSEASRVIPITYVPARNTIFLAMALGYAEIKKANSIWHGANYIDYSGYPDCRPEYFESLQDTFNLATKMTVPKEVGGNGMFLQLRTPLVYLSKKEIVELGEQNSVPWELTYSCYEGEPEHCGTCPSCDLRKKGFNEAGVKDPTVYKT